MDEPMSENDDDSLASALEAEFDKQTADEPIVEEVEETVVPVEAEATVETSDDEQTEVAEVAAPEHWSAEDKDAYMRMDDSGREWALRLEKNAHKGIEEKSKELKKFREVVEPYRHLIPAGVDESAYIKNLFNAQAYLQNSPVEGVKWLMRNLGVDEKQFSKTDDTQDDPYLDPEIRKLRDEITALKQGSEDRARQSENQRQRAFLAEIEQFKSAADEDGKVLHPHYNDVMGVMAGLMQSGRADSLDAAYEQAVWAVPEYRDSVVEKLAKERASKELADKTKKVEAAKKAATTVKGKQSAKKPTEAASLTDSLNDAYDKSVRGEL